MVLKADPVEEPFLIGLETIWCSRNSTSVSSMQDKCTKCTILFTILSQQLTHDHFYHQDMACEYCSPWQLGIANDCFTFF